MGYMLFGSFMPVAWDQEESRWRVKQEFAILMTKRNEWTMGMNKEGRGIKRTRWRLDEIVFEP